MIINHGLRSTFTNQRLQAFAERLDESVPIDQFGGGDDKVHVYCEIQPIKINK